MEIVEGIANFDLCRIGGTCYRPRPPISDAHRIGDDRRLADPEPLKAMLGGLRVFGKHLRLT